jgi:hypothetical protein
MRIIVHISDDVFSEVEALARQMKVSRSKVYSLALAEYVALHTPEHVTETWDQVCAEIEGESVDAFTVTAARQILDHTEW